MRSFLNVTIIAMVMVPAAAAAQPCAAPANIQTRHRDYVIEEHGDTLRVFHMAGACGTVVGEVPIRGRLAFASLDDHTPPSIHVETWLVHGDRLLRRYEWTRGGDAEVGGPDGKVILGPRRKP